METGGLAPLSASPPPSPRALPRSTSLCTHTLCWAVHYAQALTRLIAGDQGRTQASAAPPPPSPAMSPPSALHSTSTAVSSLVSLAHDSFRDSVSDYADAHRWIDSFFDKLESRSADAAGASRSVCCSVTTYAGFALARESLADHPNARRLPLTELMKTPGRKRTVGANSTNHPATGHSAAKKDPLATLLFANGSPRSRSVPHDKENGLRSPTVAGGSRTSPRKMLSPLASANHSPRGAASPVRLSPQPPAKAAKSAAKKASPPAATEPVVGEQAADDEPDVAESRKAADVAQDEPADSEASAGEVAKADLSIIGEEEEEDEEEEVQAAADVEPVSQAPSEATTVVVPDTQARQPPAAPAPEKVLCAVRNVSNASSVAPEADADAHADGNAEEDHTVPLNDAPSTLRSAELSSSLAASTTRTPGSTTSRFTLGTYSAGKLGALGLGSSPPAPGTAPSTVGGRLTNPRISSGGPAPRQLNFVGLPKKSLGHGLGRTWTNASASGTTDSQGSATGGSQSTVVSATSVEQEVTQVAIVTAHGGSKRKSLTSPDSANKNPKLAEPALTEQEIKRKRYEELSSRMQSLQSRQSVLGGRTSNVAGPFGSGGIFGAGKSFASSSSSIFPPPTTSVPASKLEAAATGTAVAAPTPAPIEGNQATGRRPSVMERVRSFESNTTGIEAMHPPSPSKAAAIARPTSPPLSPRRLASPTPASPRLLTRSTTSNLPLASPRSRAAPASPRPGALARSPSAQAAMVSFSSALAGRGKTAAGTPPVQVKLPAGTPGRSIETTAAQRSHTPDGSPPPVSAVQTVPQQAKSRQHEDVKEAPAPELLPVDKETDGGKEEDEEEAEPVQTIRAINASTGPAEVASADAKATAQAQEARDNANAEREAAARRAAEAAARALDEQEAQREREELLKKRLPSLPEPRAATDDEDTTDDEQDGRSEQQTATRELAVSKQEKGAVTAAAGAISRSTPAPMTGDDEEENDRDELQDEDDVTSMSVLSTATASTTVNLSQHQPFKPVVAHKGAGQQKTLAKSSIASTASSTSTLSRSVSNATLASSLSKKPKIEVNAVKRAAAIAKKVRLCSSDSSVRPVPLSDSRPRMPAGEGRARAAGCAARREARCDAQEEAGGGAQAQGRGTREEAEGARGGGE